MKTPSFAKPFLALAAILLATFLARQASAQCANWLPGPLHVFTGTDYVVIASTTWDPDGAGSLTAQLVIGGEFYTAGGTVVNCLARWDGTNWQPIGGGVSSTVFFPGIYAVAVFPPGSPFAGQLVVAGVFDHAGTVAANNIARWDGTQWQPFGSGTNATVDALTFWDPDGSGSLPPQLIAGGFFTTAGGVSVDGIARWDGSAWQPFGSGVSGSVGGSSEVSINALTTWDPDGTGPLPAQLIAGGFFVFAGNVAAHGIARWDGASWNALSAGVNGDPNGANASSGVVALTTWDPDGAGPLSPVLVAAGFFDTAGGVTVNGIGRWNGTAWTGFSTGMNDEVEALTVFNGQLIAGGDFTTAGGAAIESAARWTGTAWQAMGQGVNSDILTLTPWTPPGGGTQQLAAGGWFWESGNTGLNYVASGDGAQWLPFSPPAVNVNLYALAQMGPNLVGGGSFLVSGTTAASPDDIAAWNGVKVTAFGTGFNAPPHAFNTYNTGFGLTQDYHIVAGGEFTTAGSVAASHVAQWTQNAVVGFPGPAWQAMGSGFNHNVLAIERFNNTIYAAGSFTASGSATLNHIASWNGASWQPVGSASSQGLDGVVNAMAVYNGMLYVGGGFTHAANGSILTGGLAAWDGTAWHSVGGNFAGTVDALAIYNSQLVIGGLYPGIAGSPNLAEYNGSTYSVFGAGGTNAAVLAIAAGSDGRLYIGGNFTNAGGVSNVNHIAAWNGSAWSSVGGGTNASVYALYPYHNEIEVGGFFTTVGSAAIASPGWARYTTDGIPWDVGFPTGVAGACVGSGASFSARAAEGYSVAYTWRHNGVPITYGVTPWGADFSTDGATLDIANIHAQEVGSYDAVLSNSCGSSVTPAAALSICFADFNCDGVIAVADIFAYLSAWFAGDMHTDVNGVNGISVQDVFDFLNDWFAGC